MAIFESALQWCRSSSSHANHVCISFLLCSKETPPDVFESVDQDLTVVNAFTATHMLRLNKFNVVPYHALTITRQFESQQAPLTLADWEATFKVMQVCFHLVKGVASKLLPSVLFIEARAALLLRLEISS